MTINLGKPEINELRPNIIVVGVGGAGGNAVNNMIDANLQGVDFVVANTDAQALAHSRADRRLQLGLELTEGLGAGSRPEIGRAAAEEAMEQIIEQIQGTHLAFITAGMGGGTGTGAAPVIAKAAREHGILTVGVVTKPFQFEGSRRAAIADHGIEELQKHVDTLIIIPNQNLFRVANERTTFADAFSMADNVLHSGVRGITDLMVMPGLINLDFADVRTVMSEMGKAMMGTGEAEGEKRAIEAAEAAISNPLLDDVSMKGARGVLINITGGMDLTLFEVDEAANRIRSEVDPDANIIVGSTFDESLDGSMRVSVFATGIEAEAEHVPAVEATPVAAAVAASATVTPMPARPAEPTPAPAAPTSAPAAAVASLVRDVEDFAAKTTAPVADAPVAQAPVGETPANETPASDSPEMSVVERAVARESEAFIAPPPVEAAPSAPTHAPDPFAEAALANGGHEDERRKRGLSLLERMTGRARRKAAGETPARPQAEAAKPEPRAPAPSLGAADPKERITQPMSLEEQLEIPAFLRRQAN
jgi:cell division protein FtsZ